ncbi:MAG: ABC transporter permease [Anaerolineae bacterium]
MPIYLFILRRILFAIPVLLGITLVSFVIGNAVPADPVLAYLGQRSISDPDIVANFKREWGLDQSLPVQYLTYLNNVVHGNLGVSIRSRQPVLEDLRTYFPATIELATTSIILALVLGVSAGLISAVWRNHPIDFIARFVSLIGVSAPVFWLAIIFLVVFYQQLGWVPGPGRLDVRLSPPPYVTGFFTLDSALAGQWNTFWNAVGHLVLPSVVLASYSTGVITRVTRSSMLEVLSQDYVRTARSKGLRERAVVLIHAFSNARLPVVTVIGLSYSTLLTGAVLTETIFAWPGIGRYVFRASTSLDFPAIMGSSLVIAFVFVISNLAVDVLYYLLDPRIRAS